MYNLADGVKPIPSNDSHTEKAIFLDCRNRLVANILRGDVLLGIVRASALLDEVGIRLANQQPQIGDKIQPVGKKII